MHSLLRVAHKQKKSILEIFIDVGVFIKEKYHRYLHFAVYMVALLYSFLMCFSRMSFESNTIAHGCRITCARGWLGDRVAMEWNRISVALSFSRTERSSTV